MNSELYYENKNTTLRKDNQNNLSKEDILNVTGSILGTMLEYVDNSSEEIDTLKEENKQLKEDFIPKLLATKNRLDKDNYDLTIKLKQRDEVIDEAINAIGIIVREFEENDVPFLINDFDNLLKILQKHKGDNK